MNECSNILFQCNFPANSQDTMVVPSIFSNTFSSLILQFKALPKLNICLYVFANE